MNATTSLSSRGLLGVLIRWLTLALLTVATASALAGPTTTTLTSSINPANTYQATTLTALVTGNSPTGTITFKDGTTTLGTFTLNGTGTYGYISVYFTQIGTHNLTATYAGDANNNASTSAVLAQTVKAATTTVVSSTANPAYVYQTITIKATVSGSNPSGTVVFKDGTTTIGSAAVSFGVASLPYYFSGTGARSLTASYPGDANNSASTSAVFTQTINPPNTTYATLSTSANPAAVGQSTTLTATVSPAAAPGTITFKDGATVLGTGTLSGGTATLNTTFSTTGTHSLTASYGGGTGYYAAISPTLNQVVNSAALTTTTLTVPSTPVAVGQAITLSASVAPSAAPGTITFRDGSTTLGAVSLSGGTATLSTSFSTAGTHSLSAYYGGASGYATSTSATVNKTVDPGGSPLPAPPSSPAPVVQYQYDAQGNPTVTTLAPGNSAFNLSTTTSYDVLNRASQVTDAATGITKFGYDGLGRVTSVIDPRNLSTLSPRDGLGQTTQLQSPDTGSAQMAYDAAGNLTARTDGRGVAASYIYDALDRVTNASFSLGGQTKTYSWTYDQTGAGFSYGIGRLTTASFPEGSSSYMHDPQGRVVQSRQTVNAVTGGNSTAVTQTTNYGYDAAGHVTSIVYPSGRKLTVGYANGLPTSMSLAPTGSGTSSPLLSSISYAPFGAAQSWSWAMASGTQAYARSFDTSGRMVRYPLGGYLRDVTYDAANRITAYTHYLAAAGASTGTPAPTLDQSFGYDATGRLTQATVAGLGSYAYSYDGTGNRTSVTVTPGGSNTNTVSPTSNRVTATGNPSRTVSYDAMGNITSDGNFTLGYDLRGRLATVTLGAALTTYSYDNAGRRVRKVSSSGAASTVLFVYDEQDHLLGEYDQLGNPIREYVWLHDQPVAMFVTDPAGGANPPIVYYLFADHLNTPRVAIDKANNTRWTWMDEPFGTGAAISAPSGMASVVIPLRFPGQYYDAESGMHQNVNRDYAPGMGRYAQSDPIGLAGSINTYSYVDANPLSFTDPRGLIATSRVPALISTSPAPNMSLRPDMSPGIDICAATPYDNANKKCQAECAFELGMPGRTDNFGPYRACLRRCLAKQGFGI